MKILKRRDKLDKTITVRVPEAIKGELDQLRQRAVGAGFDVGATLRESLIGTIRQIGANSVRSNAVTRFNLVKPQSTVSITA
jgi:hypothetical protein